MDPVPSTGHVSAIRCQRGFSTFEYFQSPMVKVDSCRIPQLNEMSISCDSTNDGVFVLTVVDERKVISVSIEDRSLERRLTDLRHWFECRAPQSFHYLPEWSSLNLSRQNWEKLCRRCSHPWWKSRFDHRAAPFVSAATVQHNHRGSLFCVSSPAFQVSMSVEPAVQEQPLEPTTATAYCRYNHSSRWTRAVQGSGRLNSLYLVVTPSLQIEIGEDLLRWLFVTWVLRLWIEG